MQAVTPTPVAGTAKVAVVLPDAVSSIVIVAAPLGAVVNRTVLRLLVLSKLPAHVHEALASGMLRLPMVGRTAVAVAVAVSLGLILGAAVADEAPAMESIPKAKPPAATPASIDLLDRIALDNAFPFDVSASLLCDVGLEQTHCSDSPTRPTSDVWWVGAMSETMALAVYRILDQGLPVGSVRPGMRTAVLEAWCQVRGGCGPVIPMPKVLF